MFLSLSLSRYIYIYVQHIVYERRQHLVDSIVYSRRPLVQRPFEQLRLGATLLLSMPSHLGLTGNGRG